MVKYFYLGKSVYEFCKLNNLVYANVVHSIIYYRKKYESDIYFDMSMEKIVDMVMKKQIKKQKQKNIVRVIKIVDDDITKYNVFNTCKILGIDYNSVYRLKKLSISIREAILMILYFHDKNSADGSLSISKQRVDFVLQHKTDFNNGNLTLVEFVGYYRLYHDMEIVNLFMCKREKIIRKMIVSKMMKLGFSNNYYFNDSLVSSLIELQWKLLDKTYLNKELQIINYYNLYLSGRLYDLLKKETQNGILRLDKENANEKSLLDMVPNDYNNRMKEWS